MSTYQVSTFDVWGNAEDGFEVNQEFSAGHVTVKVNATDEEIWTAMVDDMIAKGPYSRASFEWSDEDFATIYDAEDGKPVFGLRKVA